MVPPVRLAVTVTVPAASPTDCAAVVNWMVPVDVPGPRSKAPMSLPSPPFAFAIDALSNGRRKPR